MQPAGLSCVMRLFYFASTGSVLISSKSSLDTSTDHSLFSVVMFGSRSGWLSAGRSNSTCTTTLTTPPPEAVAHGRWRCSAHR